MALEDYLYLTANLSLFATVLLAWAALVRRRVTRPAWPDILLGLFVAMQSVALLSSAATRDPAFMAFPWAVAMVAVEAAALGLLVTNRSTARTSSQATALTLAFVIHSAALLRMSLPDPGALAMSPFWNVWYGFHLLSAAAALGAQVWASGAAILGVTTALSARVRPAQPGTRQRGSGRLLWLGARAAFALLTASIFARLLWAYLGWGSYWSWRPPGVGLLALWVVMAITLHLPARSRWHEAARALLVLAGLLLGLLIVPSLGQSLITGL